MVSGLQCFLAVPPVEGATKAWHARPWLPLHAHPCSSPAKSRFSRLSAEQCFLWSGQCLSYDLIPLFFFKKKPTILTSIDPLLRTHSFPQSMAFPNCGFHNEGAGTPHSPNIISVSGANTRPEGIWSAMGGQGVTTRQMPHHKYA